MKWPESWCLVIKILPTGNFFNETPRPHFRFSVSAVSCILSPFPVWIMAGLFCVLCSWPNSKHWFTTSFSRCRKAMLGVWCLVCLPFLSSCFSPLIIFACWVHNHVLWAALCMSVRPLTLGCLMACVGFFLYPLCLALLLCVESTGEFTALTWCNAPNGSSPGHYNKQFHW